ncbi:MAG: hypothetical protein AAF589_08115 [Planctomycetota bacterium]
MKRKAQKRRPGPSKAKLVLIAVLGVVLVGVWGSAFLGGGDRPTASERRPRTRRPGRSAAQPDPPKAQEKPIAAPTDWPEIPIAEAVLNDPFGKPEWAITEPVDETEPSATAPVTTTAGASPEQLQEAGASMIVIAGGEKIATIGDVQVRVGDTVGGYEVLDITPLGVVLSAQLTGK